VASIKDQSYALAEFELHSLPLSVHAPVIDASAVQFLMPGNMHQGAVALCHGFMP